MYRLLLSTRERRLLPLNRLPAPRRQSRPPPPLRSLIPNDVDLLSFAVLVLEAEDARWVELSDAGEVVGALLHGFFSSGADWVEGFELPPSVLLREKAASVEVGDVR
jgi:hypothetical protein